MSILFLVNSNFSIPFLILSSAIPNICPTSIAHNALYTKCSPPTGTLIFTKPDGDFAKNSLLSSFNFISLAVSSLSFCIPNVCISILFLFFSYHLCNKSLSLLIIILGTIIPSNISNLAFNIFSLDPKLPICDVPILVITAKVGLAISVSRLISPK